MQYFLNSQRVIHFWIITESELLCGVVIHYKLPISEITTVQMSSLMSPQEETMLEYRIIIKTDFIDEAMK